MTFEFLTRRPVYPNWPKNLIRSSHGDSTPSLKISCKSVQPFSCNVADKETKKQRKKSPENNTPPPWGVGVNIKRFRIATSASCYRIIPALQFLGAELAMDRQWRQTTKITFIRVKKQNLKGQGRARAAKAWDHKVTNTALCDFSWPSLFSALNVDSTYTFHFCYVCGRGCMWCAIDDRASDS